MSACPGVLGELAQHLQVERPYGALAATVDDVVERQLRHGTARGCTSAPMGGLDRRDGVGLGECEGSVRSACDADFFVGPAGDGLVEPDAFDVGNVLEQAEQGGLRRHETPPRLLVGHAVEAVM